MKTLSALLFLSGFLLSCSSEQSPSEENRPNENTLEQLLTDLPDSLLKDKKANANKFRIARKMDTLDLKLMKKLNGTWRVVSKEDLTFLETELNNSDTVVFCDSSSITMTGWGEMTYNSTAQFYDTKYISHQYEFHVTKNNKLVLTWIEYRHDNLSFRQKPELKNFTFAINFSNADLVELTWEKMKFTLVRVPAH